MNASGSRRARMATYSAVHGPMPGSRDQRAAQLGRVGAGVDHDVAALHGLGQRAEGPAPSRRHGERTRVTAGQLGQRRRRREEVGDRAVGLGERVSRRLHEPAGDRPRPGDRDLLADDGAHGELETVGGARHPPARVLLDHRPEVRVAPQGLPDGDGVGVEVEQLAAARHRGRQVAQVGEHELALDVGRAVRHRCHASAPSRAASGAASVTIAWPWGRRRLRR